MKDNTKSHRCRLDSTRRPGLCYGHTKSNTDRMTDGVRKKSCTQHNPPPLMHHTLQQGLTRRQLQLLEA